MSKPVRLVALSSSIIPDEHAPGEVYDPRLGCTVAPMPAGLRPVVEVVPSARTVSKTKTDPGDDDDDVGRERCY